MACVQNECFINGFAKLDPDLDAMLPTSFGFFALSFLISVPEYVANTPAICVFYHLSS